MSIESEALDRIDRKLDLIVANTELGAGHYPRIAPVNGGTWGVFCHQCSHEYGDFIYPCRVEGGGFEFPLEQVLVTATRASLSVK